MYEYVRECNTSGGTRSFYHNLHPIPCHHLQEVPVDHNDPVLHRHSSSWHDLPQLSIQQKTRWIHLNQASVEVKDPEHMAEQVHDLVEMKRNDGHWGVRVDVDLGASGKQRVVRRIQSRGLLPFHPFLAFYHLQSGVVKR
jgi:hypothetical protein